MKLKTKFQDNVFDLGEVVEADFYHDEEGEIKAIVETAKGGVTTFHFKTLEGIYNLFEDYEEPKMFYIVENRGEVGSRFRTGYDYEKKFKEIGNYFETEEEAKKAVEKLKARKRLKDKGFKFVNNSLDICCHTINFKVDTQFDMTDETSRDLHLIFGGEE